MVDVAEIESCVELTSAQAATAATSRAELERFFRHVLSIAKPEQGAAKSLMVIGKLAAADWLDGDLRAELVGSDGEPKRTMLTLYCEPGAGIRERLLPPFDFPVPIDEFQRAIVLSPRMIHPLKADQGRNRLTIARGDDGAELLRELEVDEASLGDGERITVKPPPGEEPRDSGEFHGDADEADVHTRPTRPPEVQS